MENKSAPLKIEFYPDASPKQRISRVKQTTSMKSSSNLRKKRARSRNSATARKLIRKRDTTTAKNVRDEAIPSSPSLDINSIMNQMEVSRSNFSFASAIHVSDCQTVLKKTYVKSYQQDVTVSERKNLISEDEYDPTLPQLKYIEHISLNQMEKDHETVHNVSDSVEKNHNTGFYNKKLSVSGRLNSIGADLTADEYDPTCPKLKYIEQFASDQMEIIRSYSRKVNTFPMGSASDLEGNSSESDQPADQYDPMQPQIKNISSSCTLKVVRVCGIP